MDKLHSKYLEATSKNTLKKKKQSEKIDKIELRHKQDKYKN